MENFRISVEQGAASLLDYLSSVDVRGDTKLSAGIGVLAGLAIVVAISAFPGKPIDYAGVGIDLPSGMRGPAEALEADAVGQSKKHDPEEEPRDGAGEQHQRAAGLKQIDGVVKNLSELRRRSRKATDEDGPALTLPAPASAAGEEDCLVRKSSESAGTKTEGKWDASRLDEDKLARKIGSSKAARMLGLTEDQVRQAVVEAKGELQQSQSHSAPGGSGERHNGDDGIGLSGLLSLVILLAGLGALWAYLSAFPHGTLSRFLIGVFPREMETLGLAS
eukprot:g10305.t1